MRRSLILAAGAVSGLFAAAPATAQLTQPILQPLIPFNYNRGRNVSVTERDRPEYQALGIPSGGFTLFPKLDVGIGGTSNVFETDSNKRSSGIVEIVPDIIARSNWSRHALTFDAGADLRRFTAQPVRNESAWHVAADGRVDLGGVSSLTVDASTARQYESRYSGSSFGTIYSAIPFQITTGQLTYQTTPGRFRIIGTVAYSGINFFAVTTPSGTSLFEKTRNRDVLRGSARLEYALTPDVSTFVQLSYVDTNYNRQYTTPLTDRSSHEVRGIAGISLDLTALIRGSFGIGYVSRRYRSALFPDVQGLTFESRLEYFPSELTTITLETRRAIQDASVLGASGYFNTGFGLKIDHEVLRNLLVTAAADYEIDSYRGINTTAHVFAVSGGAHYLMSREVGLSGVLTYGQREIDGVVIGSQFHETSGLVSVYFQM